MAKRSPRTKPKVSPLLTAARDLVSQVEAGDEGGTARALEQLAHMRGDTLFEELGKLTRQLHEALNSFRSDARLMDIAARDMPDAKDRLSYVISMTENAAHRTLTAIEGRIPVIEDVQRQAEDLRARWGRFRQRRMEIEEFRGLSTELDEFLGLTAHEMALTHSQLTEVLMAQEFQDLTGQILRRVIELVQEVEAHLVDLVRLSGEQREERPADDSGAPRADLEAAGPAIPGRSGADVVSGQDDVDDLLSSLGF